MKCYVLNIVSCVINCPLFCFCRPLFSCYPCCISYEARLKAFSCQDGFCLVIIKFKIDLVNGLRFSRILVMQ